MSFSLKLFVKIISASARSKMQNRASFCMLAISHFISTFTEILAIWVLFDRFKVIKGWDLEELALLYGVMQMGFAFAEVFARGFDTFSSKIKSGDFDRVLLRPLSTLFQIATIDVQLIRLGRFLQGLIVLLWATSKLGIPLLSAKFLILLSSFLGISAVFYGLFIIQASISFWATETLELMHIATFGGLETGQYPLSIYHKALRLFFTFVIPLGCVGFYPISSLIRHNTLPTALCAIAPIAGFLFLYGTTKLWKFGVSYYRSTGS